MNLLPEIPLTAMLAVTDSQTVNAALLVSALLFTCAQRGNGLGSGCGFDHVIATGTQEGRECCGDESITIDDQDAPGIAGGAHASCELSRNMKFTTRHQASVPVGHCRCAGLVCSRVRLRG